MTTLISTETIIRALSCDQPGCHCVTAKRHGYGLVHCPAHDDPSPSLSIKAGNDGKTLLYCFAGCASVNVIAALRDRGLWGAVFGTNGHQTHTPLPPPVKPVKALQQESKPSAAAAGLTLEALAEAKHLDVAFLTSLGCRNTRRHDKPAVAIPYYADGGETRVIRYRHALDGGQRFSYRSGHRALLYGLDRLDVARRHGWALFVEGESDCWTGWSYRLPVYGIPGKSTWRSEWAAPFAGLTVCHWQEPDAADLTERIARDLPDLRVIVAPPGTKDLSEAHVRGDDVVALVDRLRTSAPTVTAWNAQRQAGAVNVLHAAAAPVLMAPDPLELVKAALQSLGYGGDMDPPMTVYLAATSRLLEMRPGAMPVHLLLIGPASSGKSHTARLALSLLPPEAQHTIDASSPRVLIYDDTDLAHRVLVFGEADSLPAGEDNPAASAIRNLLQDHRLRYQVTVRDPETGNFTVREIDKAGPTVLITTSTQKLGDQLDSRLFTLDVPDDQQQVRHALHAQARAELDGVAAPDAALIAFQGYLQCRAPWRVVVPFADTLATAIGQSPAASRILRDYARLVSLIKATAIIRHAHREQDPDGRYIATVEDYATVFAIVGDTYTASLTGASEGVRDVVDAVSRLKADGHDPITVTAVAGALGINKMAASRRVATALRGSWLVNNQERNRRPYHLDIGEALPSRSALPDPASLCCNYVTRQTAGDSGGRVSSSDDQQFCTVCGGLLPMPADRKRGAHVDCLTEEAR